MPTFEEKREELYRKKPEDYTIEDILYFVKIKLVEFGDKIDESVNTKIQYKVLTQLDALNKKINNLEAKIRKNNPDLLND